MHTTVPAIRRSERTDPAEEVVDSVLHAVLGIGRLMRQRSAGDSLEPASVWLLKNLADGGLRVTDLASCAHLDPSTVSRHVTQLERAGLIVRSPDPLDGRAQRVALSDEGRRQLEAAYDRRRQVLIRSLERWDPADIHDLDRLLGRFVSGVENLTADLEHSHD